jgi:Holliday junction resolvase RusA-like endonuclease
MATTKKPLPDTPILIILRGNVIPAARGRVETHENKDGTKVSRTRYPENYETWRKTFKAALNAAVANFPAAISRHFPLKDVKVEVEFHGCARGNSDLDNLIKGIKDAMVKAGILSGDTIKDIPEENPKWFEADYPVTAILIYPNWKPVSKVNPAMLQPPPGDRKVNPTAGNKRKKDPVKRSLLAKQVNSVLKK